VGSQIERTCARLSAKFSQELTEPVHSCESKAEILGYFQIEIASLQTLILRPAFDEMALCMAAAAHTAEQGCIRKRHGKSLAEGEDRSSGRMAVPENIPELKESELFERG
jgi:hypothetical protein